MTQKSNLDEVTIKDIGMSREEFDKMDQYTEDALKVDMNPDAIPDLDKLLVSIKKMLQDIESPSMKALEKKNKNEFEKILTHKYYEDIQSMKIINLLLEPARYENLDKLLDMFDRLKQVKQGNVNIQDAHKKWCEKMNEEYVYSKHGGKLGFEKKMKELKKND
jgi:uncharacterized Ntn-hydrolase superfamily protein